MLSHSLKRLIAVAWVLSSTRVSVPSPPLKPAVSAIWLVRLRRVAVSLSGPRSIRPSTIPSSAQRKVSLPVLMRTSPFTWPPVILTLSVPPLTLMLPPMLPAEMLMVSLPKPVTRLPSICPPVIVKRLLSSFMSTRPMRPPLKLATSPSSKAPMMRPPLMVNVSRLSPWASDFRTPSVMMNSSMPFP